MIKLKLFFVTATICILFAGHASAETFDQICATKPGTTKFDADHYLDADVLNCWGFENETSTNSDIYYGWKDRDDGCDDDPYIRSHPNYNKYGKGDGRADFPVRNASAYYRGEPLRDSNGDVVYYFDDGALTGSTVPRWEIDESKPGKCYFPIVDNNPAHAASGSKSIRVRYPDFLSNPGAFEPFIRTILVSGQVDKNGTYDIMHVGQGGEVWVRFSMKQEANLLKHAWNQKRFKLTAFSQSFNLEETMNAQGSTASQGAFGLVPQMYSDSGNEHYTGDYGPFDRAPGENSCLKDFTSNGLWHLAGGKKNYPSDRQDVLAEPCKRMQADVYEVYEIQLVGATNADLNNGRVRLYVNGVLTMDVSDSDMRKLFRTQPYTWLRGSGTNWYTENGGYSRIAFTLYSNHLNNFEHPDTGMWIDDVIVSKRRMPQIDGTNEVDTIRPAAPSEVSVQ